MGYQIVMNKTARQIVISHDSKNRETIIIEANTDLYFWEIKSPNIGSWQSNYAFIEGQDLLTKISYLIMEDWNTKHWDKDDNINKLQYQSDFAHTSVRKQIVKRLIQAKNDIYATIPEFEEVYGLQRAVFHSLRRTNQIDPQQFKRFYHRLHLIPYAKDDVLRFPLACYALYCLDDDVPDEELPHVDWRKMYTKGKPVNKSFLRLLHECPGHVPINLIIEVSHSLEKLYLKRPLQSRSEAIINLKSMIIFKDYPTICDIICKANPSQIKRAFRIFAKHIHISPSSWRRTRELINMLNYIYDALAHGFTSSSNMTIVGVIKQSIDIHRMITKEQTYQYLDQFDSTAKTQLPPIELPTQDNIIFLATVSDYRDEFEKMSHCIAWYVEGAIKGQHYCFHIEYEGQHATTQVDTSGRVIQSYGENNIRNEASEWGEKKLSKWGERLPNQLIKEDALSRPENNNVFNPNLDDLPF